MVLCCTATHSSYYKMTKRSEERRRTIKIQALPYRGRAHDENRTVGVAIGGALAELDAVLHERVRSARDEVDILGHRRSRRHRRSSLPFDTNSRGLSEMGGGFSTGRRRFGS